MKRSRRACILRRARHFAGQELVSVVDVMESHADLTDEEDRLMRDAIRAIGERLMDQAEPLAAGTPWSDDEAAR